MFKCIVLHSGGLDSTALLQAKIDELGADNVMSLGVHYGQRHKTELAYAAAFCKHRQVERFVVEIQNFSELLTSRSLIGASDQSIPDGHYNEAVMKETVIYGRNAMFLSIAAMIAYAQGADEVATATHASDHHIYEDCRPEFMNSVQALWRTMRPDDSEKDLRLCTPYIMSTKKEIVDSTSLNDREIARWTWSCYKGGQVHCGTCGTCVERREAIALSRGVDLTRYLS